MISRTLIILTALVSVATTTSAQRVEPQAETSADLINDVDQSTVVLHSATPYLESSTLMLVDLDLEKLDSARILDWLDQEINFKVEIASKIIPLLSDALRAGGAQRLYLTASTRSPIDLGPILIIPCENPSVLKEVLDGLLEAFLPDQQFKVHAGSKVVLAGPVTAVDRVVGRKGSERPDLILGSRQDGLLDHTIVLSLPDEARRDLIAMWPTSIPVSAPIEVSPRALIEDISTIIFSVQFDPEPKALLRLNATDERAALRLHDLIKKTLKLGGEMTSSIELSTSDATIELKASEATINSLVPPIGRSASRKSKKDALKQLGLAMHNYHDREKHLPPRCYVDASGRELFSGRVALLPYLDQKALAQAFRMDQPWDSDVNQTISQTIIPNYCFDPELGPKTAIRFPVYPGSLWQGNGPPKALRNILDGVSNTIAAVLVPDAQATEWANPKPWILSEDDPMSDLFGDREEVLVLLLDGSVLTLNRADMSNEKIKGLLTIAGKDWSLLDQ